MRRCTFVVLLAVAISVLQLPLRGNSLAAEGPNILLIGNSLTNSNRGVDAFLRGLAASADPSFGGKIARVAEGSATLEQHWNWVPNRVRDAIREGGWDFVVLQEGEGLEQSDPELFFEYVRRFDEEVRASGARTVLYMVQGRQLYSRVLALDDYAAAYYDIASERGIAVAPVGLAWDRSIAARPGFDLFAFDHAHPNIAGTYLTACVIFATVFERSPVGLAFRPADVFPDPLSVAPARREAAKKRRDMASIPDEDVRFLQRIAWETVQDYQTQHLIGDRQ